MTATIQTDGTVAGLGSRQFAYSAQHPLSPLALAWDVAGPVLVTDNLRADVAHAVSKTMWKRAYALGLISTDHGAQADRHQTYSGLWLDLVNPADYLVKWIETGCQWQQGTKQDAIDHRAELDRQDPDERDAELAEMANAPTGDELDRWAVTLADPSSDTPAWWLEWASNLVYAPKFEYLVRLGAHAWLGAGEARDPGTEWAAKMRKQWARRSARCERVTP